MGIKLCMALILLLVMTGTLNAAPNDLLNIGNIYAVQNNPSRPSEFILDSPFVITYLYTYHWNDARGKIPGTIALRDQNGKLYGPYQATGRPGQGGVPNAYWEVTLSVTVPAGEYTVVDSEPATWSCNIDSGNRGFAIVRGVPNISAPPPAAKDNPKPATPGTFSATDGATE
jgi:hypothetical protein